VVAATGPHLVNAISRLDQWTSTRAASQAVSALGRPAGAACARSVLEQTFAAAGVPLDIAVTPESPPPAAGPNAVAYRVIGRDRTGGIAGAAGSVVFFSRGSTSVLLLALRGDAKKPFSQALVRQLAATLAQRLEG
jgi:hypothetical protein